jgi:hypothetical protein
MSQRETLKLQEGGIKKVGAQNKAGIKKMSNPSLQRMSRKTPCTLDQQEEKSTG